uniref:Uncharacterized protein n=1 Tax=Caenorhabditis japonica TaxID=281687 RepID=A0A8R1E8P7_CAEJA
MISHLNLRLTKSAGVEEKIQVLIFYALERIITCRNGGSEMSAEDQHKKSNLCRSLGGQALNRLRRREHARNE